MLRAALARYLEVRHRVDIVAPELYTHGLGIVRREEIEDAAAPRVLAGAFDLLSARIAAAYERRLHLVGRVRAAVLYLKRGFKKCRRRQRPLHKARDGRGAHATLALGELIERRYPPLLRLPRRGLGGVEYKLAHQERVGLYAEHRMQVAREALGGRVVLTQDEERAVELIVKRCGEICPVYRRKPGNERRKPSALQQRGEGGGFLVFKYLVYKNIHIAGIIAFRCCKFNGKAGMLN